MMIERVRKKDFIRSRKSDTIREQSWSEVKEEQDQNEIRKNI